MDPHVDLEGERELELEAHAQAIAHSDGLTAGHGQSSSLGAPTGDPSPHAVVVVQQPGSRASEAVDMRQVVMDLLSNPAVQQASFGELRKAVAERLGVSDADLATHRSLELQGIVRDAFATLGLRQGAPHGDDQDEEKDLGAENKKALRSVYMVTFSHPRQETAQDGPRLIAPKAFSREQIKDALRGALAACSGNHAVELQQLQMVVFQERHADGELHYHVALRASKQFRFGSFKKFLLGTHGLSTHWSTTHDHYASAVGYGYVPSISKAIKDLDPAPFLWALAGEHPPLREACRAPVTAEVIAANRERARLARSENGKGEQRFEEVDVASSPPREHLAWPGHSRGPDAVR